MAGGWDEDRQSAEAATQIGQKEREGKRERDIFGRRRAENYWGENESHAAAAERGRQGRIAIVGRENEFPPGLISGTEKERETERGMAVQGEGRERDSFVLCAP